MLDPWRACSHHLKEDALINPDVIVRAVQYRRSLAGEGAPSTIVLSYDPAQPHTVTLAFDIDVEHDPWDFPREVLAAGAEWREAGRLGDPVWMLPRRVKGIEQLLVTLTATHAEGCTCPGGGGTRTAHLLVPRWELKAFMAEVQAAVPDAGLYPSTAELDAALSRILAEG